MRPYLAIIRDAFHEALVSRVLWILLIMITLFLAALVPLGFIEEAGSRLTDEDFLNRDKLVEKLVAQGAASAPSPGHRIWRLLDDATKQSLKQKAKDPFAARGQFRNFERSLQSMIERRDFFVKADWAAVKLPAAARALLAKGLNDLPDDQVARFNRLALEAAFPEEIAPTPPKQVQLAYFSWELGLPLPVEPEQLFPAINQVIVIALDILLGVGGVFVAVLVTASMIPQTFEAGSVDLLLSKPVFRAGLFLAKFVGGCAFIAINAAYFIGGLWLVLGCRFGLWNQRLLLAIPLYLFLFAIYYAVSSLAGVVWRNAIVSVVMAVVFWAVCWALGFANQLVEGLALNPRPIVTVSKSIVALGDELRVDWSMEGRLERLTRFSITLEGREEATYSRGTDRTTDTNIFATIPLAILIPPNIAGAGSEKVSIPADTMHSFDATHNKVVWVLRVRGELPNWPNSDEEFPLTVAPYSR